MERVAVCVFTITPESVSDHFQAICLKRITFPRVIHVFCLKKGVDVPLSFSLQVHCP